MIATARAGTSDRADNTQNKPTIIAIPQAGRCRRTGAEADVCACGYTEHKLTTPLSNHTLSNRAPGYHAP